MFVISNTVQTVIQSMYNLAYAAPAASENWVNKSDCSFECRSNK